jgi:hypothetical protein
LEKLTRQCGHWDFPIFPGPGTIRAKGKRKGADEHMARDVHASFEAGCENEREGAEAVIGAGLPGKW